MPSSRKSGVFIRDCHIFVHDDYIEIVAKDCKIERNWFHDERTEKKGAILNLGETPECGLLRIRVAHEKTAHPEGQAVR